MKIEIKETKYFTKLIDNLFKKRHVLQDDYKEFQDELAKEPERGELIPGCGGIRKIRLKSASRGKSGGFRVCYYYLSEDTRIYLIFIYPKNVQENLTAEQKSELKEIAKALKGKKR